MHQAHILHQSSGKAARVFAELSYRTGTQRVPGWSRARRVVAQAEYLDKGENPRLVVTLLKPCPFKDTSGWAPPEFSSRQRQQT